MTMMAMMALIDMSPLDFVQERFLSQGTFGRVFEATFQKSNQGVAIKKIAVNLNNEESVRKEAEILKSVNHPHILSLLGIVDNLGVGELWIVTELLNGGSLRPYCTGNERLDGLQMMKIGLHCWMALSYLHDQANITHKDIKPENILLHKTPDGSFVGKLCDFGLAKLKETINRTEETRIAGTVMYYPPEYAESIRNPQKADVYALGVTLCELFTNLHFWHNTFDVDLKRLEDCQILYKLMLINQGQLDDGKVQYGPGAIMLDRCNPENCPGPIKEILRQTVHYCRQLRPSAAKVQDVFLFCIRTTTIYNNYYVTCNIGPTVTVNNNSYHPQQQQQHQLKISEKTASAITEKFPVARLLNSYPIVWQGLFVLKNDRALVQMHCVSGDQNLIKCSMPETEEGSHFAVLRISQKMRLENNRHLEDVYRRMQVPNEHCVLVALPCSQNRVHITEQGGILQNAFINYLIKKQAAGIVNITQPGSNQLPSVVEMLTCQSNVSGIYAIQGGCVYIVSKRDNKTDKVESEKECEENNEGSIKWRLPTLKTREKEIEMEMILSNRRVLNHTELEDVYFWLGLVREDKEIAGQEVVFEDWCNTTKWHWTIDNSTVAETDNGSRNETPWILQRCYGGMTSVVQLCAIAIDTGAQRSLNLKWMDVPCKNYQRWLHYHFQFLLVCQAMDSVKTSTTTTTRTHLIESDQSSDDMKTVGICVALIIILVVISVGGYFGYKRYRKGQFHRLEFKQVSGTCMVNTQC